MCDLLTLRSAFIYFILLAVTLSFFVDKCWSQVSCYTNGNELTLVPEYGTNGFKTCFSNSSCYEAWAMEKKNITVTYQSGCNSCPEWSQKPTGHCSTCNSTNCNHNRARRIVARNLLCYRGGLKNNYGDQTMYCADHVTACYWLRNEEVMGEEKIVRWEAGCGTGNTNSTHSCSQCEICAGSLCNVPNELRLVDKFINRLEKIKRGQREESGREARPGQDPGGSATNLTDKAVTDAKDKSAKKTKVVEKGDDNSDYDNSEELVTLAGQYLDSGCRRVGFEISELSFLLALVAAATLPMTLAKVADMP